VFNVRLWRVCLKLLPWKRKNAFRFIVDMYVSLFTVQYLMKALPRSTANRSLYCAADSMEHTLVFM
jgi:hypothetical protein